MSRLVRMVMVELALVALSVPAASSPSAAEIRVQSAPVADRDIFLPMVAALVSPAGTYDCDEYEFGLIWTTEVITLSIDGSSVYVNPFYGGVARGTWVYTPAEQLVSFTNFRWITATVQLPNRLWVSKYLPDAGFDIALSCGKRTNNPTLKPGDRLRTEEYSARPGPEDNPVSRMRQGYCGEARP